MAELAELRDFVDAGRGRIRRGFASLLGVLVTSVALAGVATAQSGEIGSVCIRDFSDNANCSSSDVLAEELTVVQVVESCEEGAIGVAVVVVDAVLSAAVSRYDLGVFVALEGGSALDGPSCYHDYLEPPLSTSPVYGDDNGNAVPDLRNGPWANLEPFVPGDECGDIGGGTEAIKSLATTSVPITIDCVDTNQDGNVDASVCVTWQAGNQGVCGGLSDATPSSSERCSCARVEVVELPEPGVPLSLACGGALLAFLRRRAAQRAGHGSSDARRRSARCWSAG